MNSTQNELAPTDNAAPETLHDLLQRDLDAWMAAKEAIAKAMGERGGESRESATHDQHLRFHGPTLQNPDPRF